MAKLSADSDIENRNALEALDKTLKNIIEMSDKKFDVSIQQGLQMVLYQQKHHKQHQIYSKN
ncbi:hypothetical protein RND71_044074 [Anisodus tanguticus]|uniref:Uncharacterized protein n=1 Tax=Anisodus tanguticus TaxID=243964 RepID=A0AAE1QP45_9SOLA|nr:hypothetical protein RND71_044074 [Anisodus tanguticus]